MQLNKFFLGAMIAAVAGVGFAAQADASVIFSLDQDKNNVLDPLNAPWVVATFENDGANQVKLTLDATGLQATEKLTGFYFNVTAEFAGALSLTNLEPGVATGSLSANQKPPGFGAGDPAFSYLITFPQNGVSAFQWDEIATFRLSATGLTEDAFNVFIETTKEDYTPGILYAAGRIQSIGEDGEDSSVIWGGDDGGGEIPEPASLGVLGLGALALMARRRKA